MRSGADLDHIDQLDPKLWAALACPVTGLHFDEKTLRFIDTDADSRVRVPEVVTAVKWACACLKDPGLLLQPAAEIPLDALNESTPEGAALVASIRTMLSFLGKQDQLAITLADAEIQQSALATAPLNGDGVVVVSSTADSDLKALMVEVMRAFPSVTDSSGKPGVDQSIADQFFAAAVARVDWLANEEKKWLNPAVSFADAFASLNAVRVKIDDYFSRCRAAQFDPLAVDQLNQSLLTWGTLAGTSLSADCRELLSFPLAKITPTAQLDLASGLNPAWGKAIEEAAVKVIQPVSGRTDALTFADWQKIKGEFDAYQAWRDGEAGREVAFLSPERLMQLVKSDDKTRLQNLIADDLAVKPQVQAFADVEKLIRYRLHLKMLLDNFVNFTEFYSDERRAVFEAGTLYLDGRACELCIEVQDSAKHALLAGLSKCFLVYCDCTRPGGLKKTIAVAFTGGAPDNLLVGRNGVFFDRAGRDWDATITKLIENPISIRQAFFSPYKRLIRFIEEQSAKRASAADAERQASLESKASQAFTATDAKTAQAVPKPKFDLSIVALLGVAVGGIATALGLLLQAFFGLGWLMPLGLVGLFVLISGPSVFIAWLKLRQRNLGPILDASGWAVNSQVKINIPFGSKLTEIAALPAGAKRNLHDPYAEKKSAWPSLLAVLALVIVFALGWCRWSGNCPWLPGKVTSPAPVVTEPASSESP